MTTDKLTARSCFVDDLAIGARTQIELDTAVKALKGYFANLSAGPLTLKTIQTINLNEKPTQGIHYLGYKIWKDKFTKDIRICPNARSFGRMKKEIAKRALNMIALNFSAQETENAVLSYTANWAQQFHMWSKTETAVNLLEITALTQLSDTYLANSYFSKI